MGKMLVIHTVHPQSNKIVSGVKIKATDESKLRLSSDAKLFMSQI